MIIGFVHGMINNIQLYFFLYQLQIYDKNINNNNNY